MGGFIAPFIYVVMRLLDIYEWVVIIAVGMSWLLAFGVITTSNHLVRSALDLLYRLTEPVFRPIRNFMPNLGGLDLSPLIVLVIIWLIQMELAQLTFHLQQF